jgi:hypothetical protein
MLDPQVESLGKTWLLTIGDAGCHPSGGKDLLLHARWAGLVRVERIHGRESPDAMGD